MATSLIIEVSDSHREAFARANTKAEWYEALQSVYASEAPSLDGQDSFPAWEYAISTASLESPVSRLFVGDLRADTNDSSGPNIAFHGSASTSAIASGLAALGEASFRRLLAQHGHEPDIWLYPALSEFFQAAAGRGAAVVVLWGS